MRSTASDMEKMQTLYVAKGFLVTATAHRQPLGPVKLSDWQEDEMNEQRWNITAESTAEEFRQQQRELGWPEITDPVFRFFYRMVAMD